MMDETQIMQALKMVQSNPDLAAKILSQTGMAPEEFMQQAGDMSTQGSLIPTGGTGMVNNTLGTEIEPIQATSTGGVDPKMLSSIFGMMGKTAGGSSDVKPIFPSGMAKAPEPMKLASGTSPATFDALIKLLTSQKAAAAPVVPSLGQLMRG